MAEFGALCLPGMDHSTPKWLERKTMPFNAPWTKCEDSRYFISPPPGRQKMPPIPNPPRDKPRHKFDHGPEKDRKVKWGIPFITQQYVKKHIPSMILEGAWKNKKTI